jgi:Zn-dependent M32 family carboxypeptidase
MGGEGFVRVLEEVKRFADGKVKEALEAGDYELALEYWNIVPDLVRGRASMIGRSEYTGFMSRCMLENVREGMSMGEVQEVFKRCTLEWRRRKEGGEKK